MRVYLDNCCFNRPYDDQSQVNISLEAQAKLHIQDLIKAGKLELVSSFMLYYENDCNPHGARKEAIRQFLEDYTISYVDENIQKPIETNARIIMGNSIKYKDAVHVACAMYAKCDLLITTDKRLLKYHSGKLKIITPTEFFIFEEGEHYVKPIDG